MTGATSEGTRRYAQRMTAIAGHGHFREREGLLISSIGLGTYLGHWDEHTDRSYHEAVIRATELGCNVIDSAINYRFQRSERNVGDAIRSLMAQGFSRDELVVATNRSAGIAAKVSAQGSEPKPPRAAA